MLIPHDWKDYELIDAGGGEKLERFGGYTVVRPDPVAIWQTDKNTSIWLDAHMHYHRSSSGGGSWEIKKPLPKRWEIEYRGMRFIIQPTDFKHMGIFPEQASNWDWVAEKLKSRPNCRVLNLFAYTGCATSVCAYAGATVCHVDAAKGMNNWAKENARLSKIPEERLRFIADDVLKFVAREKRRGSKYDAVIMDPPSYGRGPSGEVFKLTDSLYELVWSCVGLLSDDPLFFLLNSYTAGLSPVTAYNVLSSCVNRSGKTTCGELGLEASRTGLVLPCGIYCRWENV